MLTSRNITHNKEGIRCPDKRDYAKKVARDEIKTVFKKIVMSLNRKVGLYKIVDFVAEYNHSLQSLPFHSK